MNSLSRVTVHCPLLCRECGQSYLRIRPNQTGFGCRRSGTLSGEVCRLDIQPANYSGITVRISLRRHVSKCVAYAQTSWLGSGASHGMPRNLAMDAPAIRPVRGPEWRTCQPGTSRAACIRFSEVRKPVSSAVPGYELLETDGGDGVHLLGPVLEELLNSRLVFGAARLQRNHSVDVFADPRIVHAFVVAPPLAR